MFSQLIFFLQDISVRIPLELFCLIGSFVEEMIGPIPSPLILMTSGSIANTRQILPIYLIVLAIFASIGKTFASWVLYYLADKGEDLLFKKFGKVLGITHAGVEKVGAYFNGTWKDDFFIFIFRAIPIFPTTAVSIASGLIKLDQQSFVRSTFVGFFVRSLFLLYLGYTGVESFGIIKTLLAE